VQTLIQTQFHPRILTSGNAMDSDRLWTFMYWSQLGHNRIYSTNNILSLHRELGLCLLGQNRFWEPLPIAVISCETGAML
jgi:hypothetical protein